MAREGACDVKCHLCRVMWLSLVDTIAMVLSKVDLEHFGIDLNSTMAVEDAVGFARGW